MGSWRWAVKIRGRCFKASYEVLRKNPAYREFRERYRKKRC